MKNRSSTVAIASAVLLFTSPQGSANPALRKSLPDGVLEIPGIAQVGGIVGLNNGSLMLAQEDNYRISTNGDTSWSDLQPLQPPFGVELMIQLQQFCC